MPAKVLDSWALLAFFKDEPAAAAVEGLIEAATKSGELLLLLSAANWAEIYCPMDRAGGRAVADEVAAEIVSLPIEMAGLGDGLELARQAARFKAGHKLNRADAFAAALAKDREAELVTRDLGFKALEREVRICWLILRTRAKGHSVKENRCLTWCSGKHYVMSKLTLHVPEELIAAAKSEAAARRVSVSKLVTDFFAALAADPSSAASEISRLAPRTRRLAGCIPKADPDLEDYIDHLERKHS
jgi:uncharacterized protein with PIN domain